MLKKILIGILIIILIGILSMVVLMKAVNRQRASNEKLLQSKNTNPKKALIVFQPSLSNVTTVMANSIAKGLNDGGYEVTLNYPGSYLSTDVSKYSLVIFGSPVYVGKPLTIVTDFMSKIKSFSNTKVVVFSTGGTIKDKPELDIMEKSLNGISVYKKVKFNSSTKEASKNEAYDLGKELSKE